MVPSAVTLELSEIARARRAEIMDELTRALSKRTARDEVSQCAVRAVNEYGTALLTTLMERLERLSPADDDWVRDQCLDWMVELAQGARDLVSESGARHAVAQALQCAILLHERRLRIVLANRALRRG